MRKLFAFCLIACCVVGLSLGCGSKTETKPATTDTSAGAGDTGATATDKPAADVPPESTAP
ncbi:MAG: hypothetical protein LBU65_05005 [Planctomycetaceae bacterium]|nr:hypothetical protein [Planctomycetaceae bacterium]